MPRLLSIDYGRRRTGIAVTDPLQIVPGGLCTVPTHTLLDFLRDYTRREAVERVIIGLPTQTDGTPSENQARVRQFVARLKKEMPQLPVTYYDERFTSRLAHRAMLDGGLPRMKRRDKALVDEISACIILQDYMESRQRYSE
ncbi:MAG: Holliday junction resolvase RuvX [Bacteroidaceae bacterium]|nr:Holliday junction resolvase RuvX [Bacteroidaceae bacterium]